MQAVVEPVLLLFFVIGMGFLVNKSGRLHASLRASLTSFVMNLGLPMFILYNMNFSFDREILMNSAQILVMSLAAYVVMMVTSLAFARRSKLPDSVKPAYQFGMTFSNAGFMGYPVIAGVFGAEAVFYAAIFNIGFETFLWTYGVSIFKQDYKLKLQDLVTPNLIALMIGLLMFVLDLNWPPIIERGIEMVGKTATPLSMIIIGIMLSEIKVNELVTGIRPFLMAAYRLLVIPLVAGLIFYLLGIRGLNLVVPVMILGMPVAANGAMLADYYGRDYHEVTRIVVISTLLSLITVPIWSSIFLRLLACWQ